MSENQADRPPRTRPRPAADAGVDPIDYKPATSAPTFAAAPTRETTPAAPTTQETSGGVEATVQLSTRVSLDVNDVLTQAHLRTGKKKRALIEEAILRTWSA